MNNEQNLDSFLQYVSGKTFREYYPQKTAHLDISFQDLWVSTFQSNHLMDENFQIVGQLFLPRENVRGDSLTLNTSEAPNHVRESTLWQVLVKGSIPERYYLSSRACEGIINRADKKGKPLPQLLHLALEATIAETERLGPCEPKPTLTNRL